MAELEKLNGYELSKQWFDFAFENPDVINTNHTAMYLWFIELNNKMGWVDKFASPASQTMAATGIRSYNTYKKTFNELVDMGCVTLLKKSQNQYSACVIALSKFDKAPYKALDKALMNHLTDQLQSTVQINDSIIKQQTINNKQQTTNNIPVAAQSGEEEFIFFDELITEKGKEKKLAPKKRKEGSTEFFNGAKDLFLQFFQEQNNTVYYFSAKDAAAIKGIEKQIEQQIKDKGVAVLNEDSKLAGFRHFLKIAWINGGDWLKANYSLSILNSKFSLIVSNYNNQRNGQSKTEQQLNDDRRTSRHALNDLAEKIVFSFNS